MKLKLKTILMSAKAEVSLQSKYCLNKNSLEPPNDCNGKEKLRTEYIICVKVPLRRCLSTSAESFFIIIKCHLLLVERLSWISSCSESFLNASIFETGDKRRPMGNKLEHFTQKERNWLRYATLLKKSGSETFLFCARPDTVTPRLQ